MKNIQSGGFKTACGCASQDGKGNSGIGSVNFDFEVNKYFSIGAKIGFDSKSTSSSGSVRDSAMVRYSPGDSAVLAVYDINSTTEIRASYLFFSPYLSYTPFGTGFFVQLSPEFGSILSSNITQTRELPNKVIVAGKDTITNIRFQNGTRSETLENEQIKEANKLRIAIFFSAGYDFNIANNFSILPQVSYNLPLTNISNSAQSTNWKIASYAFSLGLKCRLD